MAIAAQGTPTSSSVGSFPSSPMTFAYDAGAGSDRFVAVWVWTFASNANAISGVTYGGASASASGTAADWSGTHDHFNVYLFDAAATGSNNVVVSWTGTPTAVVALAAGWTGVASSGNAASRLASSGDTTATSPAITTTSGDTAAVLFLQSATGERLTVTGTAQEILDADVSGAGVGIYMQEAVGSTTTIVCDSDGSNIFENAFGFRMTPAGGGSSFKAAWVPRNQSSIGSR